MKKAFNYGALICIILVFVVGCSGMQLGADNPKQVYLKARMTFNGLLSDYISNKKAAPPDVRARWTKKVDPLFEKAGKALDAWGKAAMAEAPAYNQQQAYLELKNQLLNMLLAEVTDYKK